MRLVLGVDAGGTSTRAALFTLEGEVVRRGRAGGANPGALGPSVAAANLTSAVRAALSGATPPQVEAVVVGVAGSPAACAQMAAQVFRDVLPGVPVTSVGDLVTAFAAGTPLPSGSVLISGTGAIAAKIIDHRAVAIADGFGWQLGDEGSAFWLGRAAARTTIRTLAAPGLGGGGELVALVVRHLLPDGPGQDPVARLAAAVHARPPLALAELAPLVSRAAEAGDPVAARIVREAASRLVTTLRTVHDTGPVVLAGSVLTSAGPMRRTVTELLTTGTAGAADAGGVGTGGVGTGGVGAGGVVVAGDPAGAAAWLAARERLSAAQAEALHPAFTATA
ncbi:N-acetylglucosamine kinase [[Actinomadura] parvosata]|uniref:N-acetylglucosamine kinase n=1 Tax=[Actinomadura] parvosata TaxID=1955412 RepID=UPI0009ABE96E|nr:BadF/BadG/BcrA/BcrD ATPase family protein [Nonomuraea sp. ATCC 55076]